MALTASTPPPFFLVKVADLPPRLPFDFATVILDRAREVFPSFLNDRSFFAPRHDALAAADRTWAALSFTSQDDAVKCARWLLEEPQITVLGPPAVSVLRRIQSPGVELAAAAAEQAQRESDLAMWQDRTASLRLTTAQEKLAFGAAAAAAAAGDNGRKKSRANDADDSGSSMSTSSADTSPRARQKAATASNKQLPQRVVLHTSRGTAGSPLSKKTAATKTPAPAPAVAPLPAKTPAPTAALKKAPERPPKRPPAPAPAPPSPIDDQKQNKAREMLSQALAHKMDAGEAGRTEDMRRELSAAVVVALLGIHLDSKAFAEKVRQLVFNLRQNEALKASVLQGATTPTALVQKGVEELATKELAEERRRLEEKSLKAVDTGTGADADTWHSTAAALAARKHRVGFGGSPPGGHPGSQTPDPSPLAKPSQGAGKTSLRSAATLREKGWEERLPVPPPETLTMVVEEVGTKRAAVEAVEDRPAKAVRFSSELEPSPEALKRPGTVAGSGRPKSALHAPPPPPLPSHIPPAWDPPVPHPTGDWEPSEELTAGATILANGRLSWNGPAGAAAPSVDAVGLRPAIDAPGVALTMPHQLDVSEGLTVAAMEAEFRAAGVVPWDCNRFWLCGPQMPGINLSKDASADSPIVGRLIISSQGHVMRSLEEAWLADVRRGWMLFIAPPTPAVATAAAVPMTEVEDARRARAFLGLAIPLYFGTVLPRGHQEAVSLRVWAAGPGALHLTPSTLNCVWNTRRGRIPNLDADWKRCFGEGGEAGQEVRLQPRPPPPGSTARSSDEVAMAALKGELRAEQKVLIVQDGILPHTDLAVTAPRAGAGGVLRGFLLLGAWSRATGPRGEKAIHDMRKYGWPALPHK